MSIRVLLTMLLGTPAGTRTASTQQTAHRLSTTISIDVEGDYLLYLPSGHEGGQAGHDSWTETYANPEFYEWLLKHQLKK